MVVVAWPINHKKLSPYLCVLCVLCGDWTWTSGHGNTLEQFCNDIIDTDAGSLGFKAEQDTVT